MRSAFLVPTFLLIASCAFGPTPERIGFNYPQAGLRFNPRRHVTSDTVRGTVSTLPDSPYTLLFPRTTSYIETPSRRLLTTGIVGEWDDDRMPLYDEVSLRVFGAELQHSFELIEERPIELPWPGLLSRTGTVRVFQMTPLDGGLPLYTFAVLVHHYGNTIEICWRDSSANPPDEQKIEDFFYWTHGIRFYEPEAEDNPA